MATVLEECTIEDQCSLCTFWWIKDSVQRIFIKKCYLFMVRSVCRLKRFTTGSRNCHLGGKYFADDEKVETVVPKWLRQKSKDFYAVGFDALVKRRDKCIIVGGGYVEEQMFFPGSNITCFISICDLFTDSLSYFK
jgi:hypothetical protein